MVAWKASLAALAGLITIACASAARSDDTSPSFEDTHVPGAYIVELADDQVLSPTANLEIRADLTQRRTPPHSSARSRLKPVFLASPSV